MNILTEEQLKKVRGLRPISASVNTSIIRTYETEAIHIYLLKIFDAKLLNEIAEYNQKEITERQTNPIFDDIIKGSLFQSPTGYKFHQGLPIAIGYLTLSRYFNNQAFIISQNSIRKQKNDLSETAPQTEIKQLSRDCLNIGFIHLKEVCTYIKQTEYKNKIKNVEKISNSVLNIQTLGE